MLDSIIMKLLLFLLLLNSSQICYLKWYLILKFCTALITTEVNINIFVNYFKFFFCNLQGHIDLTLFSHWDTKLFLFICKQLQNINTLSFLKLSSPL